MHDLTLTKPSPISKDIAATGSVVSLLVGLKAVAQAELYSGRTARALPVQPEHLGKDACRQRA